MGKIPAPQIRWRGAHPNNFTVGRPGASRDGRETFHHIVGSRESAVIVFNQPTRGASSHFVVGADIVDQCVDINNTAWCDSNWESNLRSITVEHEGGQNGTGPYSDAMYERAAHLCAWLRENYGINRYVRHRDVSLTSTACPGGLDVERIWRRSEEIIRQYNQPVTPPAPEWQRNRQSIAPKTVYAQAEGRFIYSLVSLGAADARRFPINQNFLVSGKTTVSGREFYITKSSMDLNIGNGIAVNEVEDQPYIPATPQPIPQPPKPTTPDWADSLLVDTENLPLYVLRATPLIDLENGRPVLKDGREIWYQAGDIVKDISAHTVVSNVTYQLTEYSLGLIKSGKYQSANGIKSSDLSAEKMATPPGTPANPDVPATPVTPVPDAPLPDEPVKNNGGNIMGPVSKAIAGVIAGFITVMLAKYNILISDNLPDVIEALIGAILTGAVVYVAPKNKEN